MQYLLDTSTCVFFLRRKLDLNLKIKKVGREHCFISEITVLELRYGAENSDFPIKSHKTVDDFVNGLTIIPIYSCFRRYAKEKVRLPKIGKPLHDEFDLLIGVAALENDITLVTDNTADFVNLESIQLENWFQR